MGMSGPLPRSYGIVVMVMMAVVVVLTAAYPLPDGTPEEVNLNTNALDQITRKLQRWSDRGLIPGGSFVVARAGKRVYTGNAGKADLQTGLKYGPDTISRIMSQSKPVTAVAVLILMDEGRLRLDDKLYQYNEKFRNMKVLDPNDNSRTVPANRDLTLMDLLTFTSGISYSYDFTDDSEGPVDFREFSPLNLLSMSRLTLAQLVDSLAAQPLVVQPGTEFYYGWSYDVLGYVVEKVTGQRLDVFMADRIFTPLGMQDTGFYVPREKIDRYASQYTGVVNRLQLMVPARADLLQGYRTPTLILGGAGIVTTANDYLLFTEMLLNGGELNGVRILSSRAVDLMWRNHLTASELPYSLNGWTSEDTTGYGIGVAVTTDEPVLQVDWDSHTGGERTGEIGWGGGASTNWQTSADLDISVTFMTQLMDGPGVEVFFDVVWPGIYAAVTGPSPRHLPGPIPPMKDGSKKPKGGDNWRDAIRTPRKRGTKRDNGEGEERRRALRRVPIDAN